VPADLGERGRDLRQTETVTAEAFRDTERDHATGDQRIPAVISPERGRHHVGDSLLTLVWTEVHPNPP
jgi:hypothetical protein